jgi:O-antigen/teichoic acid export membrane protein
MSAMLSAPQDPEAGANGAKDPSKQAEVGIGLAAVLGFISSGATAVLSIARSKVTAVVLGPVGVGMTAEVNQIVTMVMAPVSLASGPALIGAVAEGRASGDEAGVARAYQTATTVTVLVATVGIVLCVAVGSMLLPKPWGPA